MKISIVGDGRTDRLTDVNKSKILWTSLINLKSVIQINFRTIHGTYNIEIKKNRKETLSFLTTRCHRDAVTGTAYKSFRNNQQDATMY